MRHGKKFNHLGRKTAHRKAMLSNMSCSLIEHKRITTTVAKAKALKKYVEPLVNRSKDDSTHNRRVCFRYLASKDAVTELFREVGPKVANRDGGYTRVIRTGNRLGDNAEMCMIELVDFNEIYGKDEKKKTRRSRRGGATAVSKPESAPAEEVVAEAPAEEVVAEAPAEEVVAEAPASEDVTESSNDDTETDSPEEKKED
ncbi:MAG: 50S ribosomal protein L17 [Bacteroidetes bacterium]|nr:50S ribosomal protein L17 [Bacteroidota bacterium]